MSLSNALKLAKSKKHRLALATIAVNNWVMPCKVGRNNAYRACLARGFSFDEKIGVWVKCLK